MAHGKHMKSHKELQWIFRFDVKIEAFGEQTFVMTMSDRDKTLHSYNQKCVVAIRSAGLLFPAGLRKLSMSRPWRADFDAI